MMMIGDTDQKSQTVDASTLDMLEVKRRQAREDKKLNKALEREEKEVSSSTEPDPLWPEGAVPAHLTPGQRQDPEVQEAWEIVGGIDATWRCIECGATTGRSIKNQQLCGTCWQKAQERTALMQRTNEGWMEQAQQLGLALYERQPEETDNEWIVWEKYRSYYPLAMPRWTQLAKELGMSVGFVTKTSQRWNFKARMIQWAKAVDSEGQEKRIHAIREMNKKQLSMAQTLQEKLVAAIDNIDPQLLRPNEIIQMMKFTTELEKRITEYTEEKVEATVAEATSQVKQRTKAEDLGEVLSILQSTGLMQTQPQVVGVEQKTTILVKNGDVIESDV